MLTDLIAALALILKEHGDLPLVSGLSRSGYGEAVLQADVTEAKNTDGETEKVVDLILCDETTYET